jgi:O6-methylguanine-DNA--protein-cysteine methyltransferase
LPTQSLSNIVNVTVQVSPLSTVGRMFNLGLIVGSSTVISDTDRVKLYSGTDDMLSNGWAGSEPEYKAAQIYFSQTPRPVNVAIGRLDAISSETAVQAVTACRSANSDWYAVYVCDTVKADIEAIAAYIETATPLSAYFYETSDADVLAGTAGNVMDALKTSKYGRTFGQYSTSPHAAVAAMGYAMGANTGLTNSAYTLAYKSEVGITPESLTSTQVSTITGYNGNIYTNYGASYDLLVQGTMANGTHFDEVLNLDMLTNDIQTSVMNALTTSPKIPQTEDGVNILINAITKPCTDAKSRGIIAPGIWNGSPVLGLNTGDTLSNGYLILADTIAKQSQADRDARKSPPVYVAVKMAGAIEHVVIGVVVNQ